jgi:hypothetical protein
MTEDMAKKTGSGAEEKRERGKEELIVGAREPKLSVRKVS